MRDRQVQSLLPHGILANRQEASGLSRADEGFSQGTRLQGLSGEWNQVVHKRRTSKVRYWFAAFAVALAFWLAFLGSLFAVGAFAKCRTHGCWKRVHEHRAQQWLKAHHPWVYAWRHLTAHERAWAHCIASYETRGIAWAHKAQTDTGNGYQGSTQWLTSTWHMAGGAGEPKYHSLHEQLVRTVRWAHVAGSSQWSTSKWCGSV